ncbi:MAG: hypothetical protein ACTHL8_15585 [Burkholderiaceae bacterium]
MRAVPLQLLTWGTITAAVSSAVLMSSSNQGAVFCSIGYRATSAAIGLDLSDESPRTGRSADKPGRARGKDASSM